MIRENIYKKPGWIYMYYNNQNPLDSKMIEYKGIEKTEIQKKLYKKCENIEMRLMIKRWQERRDFENEILGDRSEFWGEENLLELFDNDNMYNFDDDYYTDEMSESDHSEDEYNEFENY